MLWLSDQLWKGSAGLPTKAEGRDTSFGSASDPLRKASQPLPCSNFNLLLGKAEGLCSVGLAFPLGEGWKWSP